MTGVLAEGSVLPLQGEQPRGSFGGQPYDTVGFTLQQGGRDGLHDDAN